MSDTTLPVRREKEVPLEKSPAEQERHLENREARRVPCQLPGQYFRGRNQNPPTGTGTGSSLRASGVLFLHHLHNYGVGFVRYRLFEVGLARTYRKTRFLPKISVLQS